MELGSIIVDVASHRVNVTEGIGSALGEVAGTHHHEVGAITRSGGGGREFAIVREGQKTIRAQSRTQVANAKAVDVLTVELDAGERVALSGGDADAEGSMTDLVNVAMPVSDFVDIEGIASLDGGRLYIVGRSGLISDHRPSVSVHHATRIALVVNERMAAAQDARRAIGGGEVIAGIRAEDARNIRHGIKFVVTHLDFKGGISGECHVLSLSLFFCFTVI